MKLLENLRDLRPIYRPTLELLETRLTPSCVVTVADLDGNGSTDLRILGDGGKQHIAITDTGTDLVLSLDCAGDGSFVDPGDHNADHLGAIESVELLLRKGDDQVSYTLTADFSGVSKHLLIDLGGATRLNTFTFDTADNAITNHSDVTLDVDGGAQSDFVTITFDAIRNSAVSAHVRLGDGRDALVNHGVVTPSSITFQRAISNSSVDVLVLLGAGRNDFEVNFFGPVGGATTSYVSVLLFGAAQTSGVDHVTANFGDTIDTGSTLDFIARLRTGNDVFRANFDLAHFGLTNSLSGTAGGALNLSVDGGVGNNTIVVGRNDTTGPAVLDGLLTLNLDGLSGNDAIRVFFGRDTTADLNAFTTSDPSALSRGLRLRVYGNGGSDQLEVHLSNDAAATFNYDVGIFGGASNDSLTFAGNDLSSNGVTFSPRGYILLDGGHGTDTAAVSGNFPVKKFNTEA